MSTLTHNRTGRPAGSRDKKKRKTPAGTKASRSKAAKKAAETRRQNKEAKAETLKSDRPDVERSDVKITTYPRAGDDPEFVKFIEEQKRQIEEAQKAFEPSQAKAVSTDELLKVEDVKEWVAWPFLLWAQSQDIKTLMLTDAEAVALAEPLTTILNRHGIAELMPPDVLDALKFAARATPVMADRFSQIGRERRKRAGQGSPSHPNASGVQGGAPPVQGAPLTTPKEV